MINIEKLSTQNPGSFKQTLFDSCKVDYNEIALKRILLLPHLSDKITNEVVSACLFSASKNNKNKLIDLFLNYLDKKNNSIEHQYLQPIFNLLLQEKKYELVDYLDKKFKFFEKDLFEYFDGKLTTDLNNRKIKFHNEGIMAYYNGNTLRFSIDKNDKNMLINLLDREKDINPELLKDCFKTLLYQKNGALISCLLTHPHTEKLILMPEIVNEINFMVENPFKKQFIEYLNFLEVNKAKPYKKIC